MLEPILLSLVIVAFALSWALYFVGWKQHSPRMEKMASGTLWFGLVVGLMMLAIRYFSTDQIPILTAFEFVSSFAFLIIIGYLVFSKPGVRHLLALFVIPIPLMLLLYALLLPKAVQPEIPIFQSIILKIHVVTCLLAYSTWTVTFAASVYCLAGNNPRIVATVDQVAYRAAVIAFCFLTLGILTGALWADQVWGALWSWDPKETWSFITWLIFLSYLHARYQHEWQGTRAAILAVAGFAAVVFTYFGVDFLLPQMHSMGMSPG
ncbi:MAG: cytochrome c biogenesis protein CcsA [Pseudomonadales bacterium]|nr:cytochrome c biogenesis protein CcsA [Pseudomonadales bacterium]